MDNWLNAPNLTLVDLRTPLELPPPKPRVPAPPDLAYMSINEPNITGAMHEA
jgi:hypothetical protein